MTKYMVIRYFTDLQDNRYKYHVGDTFPRMGLSVSKERIEQLSTSNNRQRTPLIKPIEVKEEKPVSTTRKRSKRKKENNAD